MEFLLTLCARFYFNTKVIVTIRIVLHKGSLINFEQKISLNKNGKQVCPFVCNYRIMPFRQSLNPRSLFKM